MKELKKIKEKNGITLVALVITIVVLIILAGVAINLTLGDNGIFNKAKKAKDDYASTATNEQGAINSIDIDSITGGTKVPITIITEEHYGDYIDYPIDLNEDGDTTNDWMIFYKNGGDTYIIAADYLKNTDSRLQLSNMGATATDSNSNPYSVYWNNAPTTMQTTSYNSLFMATKYTLNSSNNNSKSVSTLLNISNWVGYINKNYADYAIGSPTLEMWVASWNDKYQDKLKLYINTNEIGYYIGNIEGTTDFSTNVASVTEAYKSNSLYFPKIETKSDCAGYWIACPAAAGRDSLLRVYFDGHFYASTYNTIQYCLRPVVHLTSNISLEKDTTTGVWEKK